MCQGVVCAHMPYFAGQVTNYNHAIKYKLSNFLWNYYEQNVYTANVSSYSFVGPCSNGSPKPPPITCSPCLNEFY